MNWADQTYAIGRGIAAIRHRSAPALQHLVRAVLESELPQLLAQATGSTFPNVSAQQLADISWPEIDPHEEEIIAHVLATLDNKIDLNRQMSKTMEQKARALYTSWFINFDPIRAKQDGRWPSLPENLTGLFPNRLVDSHIGQIPDGWRIKGLDQIADFINGLALQRHPPITAKHSPRYQDLAASLR